MHYQQLILKSLPLLLTALIACIIWAAVAAPWYELVIGAALGFVAGTLIGYRGIRLIRAHILRNNRAGFGSMRRPIGILIFFIIPAIAGPVLAWFLLQQAPFIFAALVFGAMFLASWWSVMAWWVAHIEHRSGRELLMRPDGFHLSR